MLSSSSPLCRPSAAGKVLGRTRAKRKPPDGPTPAKRNAESIDGPRGSGAAGTAVVGGGATATRGAGTSATLGAGTGLTFFGRLLGGGNGNAGASGAVAGAAMVARAATVTVRLGVGVGARGMK